MDSNIKSLQNNIEKIIDIDIILNIKNNKNSINLMIIILI